MEHQLAAKFAELLRGCLGDDKIAEVVRLNRTPEYTECCASHDFCDANEVMGEAFALCGVKTFVDCSPESSHEEEYATAMKLWDNAWTLAKAAEFDAGKLTGAPTVS